MKTIDLKKGAVALLISAVLLTGCGVGKGTKDSATINNEIKKSDMEKSDYKRGKRTAILQLVHHKTAPEKLTFGIIGMLDNLNPLYGKSPSSKKVINTLYKPLYTINTDDYKRTINNVLTESVTISPDNKEMTIKLKKGILWHDSKPMTADDLVYTYSAIEKNKDTVYEDDLFIDNTPVKINKVDQYTVKFQLPRPSTSFQDTLSKILILPKHIYEGKEKNVVTGNDSNMLVGNSAYKFVKYSLDPTYNTEVIDLKFMEGSIYQKPQYENIVLRCSAHNYTSRYDLLDYNMQVGYVLPNDVPAFNNELYKNAQIKQGFDIAMVFKINNKSTNTKEMRNALATMFQSNAANGYFGTYNDSMAAESIFGPTTFHYSPVKSYYDTNQNIATEIIKRYQVANNGLNLKFGFKIEEGEYQERIAIVLQESFRVQNLNIELVPLTEEKYNKALHDPKAENVDMLLVKYDSITNPNEYKKFFKANGMENYSGYTNDELEKLWSQADSEADYVKAQILYDKIQRLIITDLPMNPLSNVRTQMIYDDRMDVKDAIPTDNGFFLYPEKLTLKQETPDPKLIEKYEISESDLKPKTEYHLINTRKMSDYDGRTLPKDAKQ